MSPSPQKEGWKIAMELVGAAGTRVATMLKDRRVVLGEVVNLATGLGRDLIVALEAEDVVILKSHNDKPVRLEPVYHWVTKDVIGKGLKVFKIHGVLLGRVK